MGFFSTGIGWYRKSFRLPAGARGRMAWLEFDGVYMNSDVWLNGVHLGRRPYGYVGALWDRDVTVPPAAVTRARKLPPGGTRPRPSTEILERLARRSQRSRMDAIAGVTGDAGWRPVAASDGADGAEELSLQAAKLPTASASPLKASLADGSSSRGSRRHSPCPAAETEAAGVHRKHGQGI